VNFSITWCLLDAVAGPRARAVECDQQEKQHLPALDAGDRLSVPKRVLGLWILARLDVWRNAFLGRSPSPFIPEKSLVTIGDGCTERGKALGCHTIGSRDVRVGRFGLPAGAGVRRLWRDLAMVRCSTHDFMLLNGEEVLSVGYRGLQRPQPPLRSHGRSPSRSCCRLGRLALVDVAGAYFPWPVTDSGTPAAPLKTLPGLVSASGLRWCGPTISPQSSPVVRHRKVRQARALPTLAGVQNLRAFRCRIRYAAAKISAHCIRTAFEHGCGRIMTCIWRLPRKS
jgi:hypothetical protein